MLIICLCDVLLFANPYVKPCLLIFAKNERTSVFTSNLYFNTMRGSAQSWIDFITEIFVFTPILDSSKDVGARPGISGLVSQPSVLSA